MRLVVRYRIQEFPSEQKDSEIVEAVGANWLSSREIEESRRGRFRVLRFMTPSREDAYFEAEHLEQLVKGLQIDVESLFAHH